ncbi:MAG: hypothetical protein WCJ62_07660 [Flavobacterium sp.]
MKKVKLMFSKVLEFFLKGKVKEPKQTDLEKSNDNDEFAGTDQVKEKKITNEIITSQPYAVRVENTTDQLIENVSLFFANNQNQELFTENGDYVKNGLIISSGICNVSYRQISNQLAIEKITVGLTYINSENHQQVKEKFSIEQSDANGNFSCKVISPTIDPYQHQSKIVAVQEKYPLNGNTSIVLHNLHPKTIVRMYFYPIKIFKN